MKANSYKRIFKSVLFIGLFCITFVLICSSAAVAQNSTVSGTVTDAQTGSKLSGVNILVVGTTNGAATDANGHYSLQVESLQDSLRFSFIGYQTKVIAINGRTSINVALTPKVVSGKQLVVVGYGTQQKQDLTGAVGSVDLKNISTQPNVTSVNGALTGEVPGVQINSTNGVPGGGPQIKIRGVSGIGAGDSPLYVVDGFPLPTSSGNSLQTTNPLTSIPPSSIESISVLKGPSATAIYGSRASNGVVVIKTKEGKGGAFQFSANASTGFQHVLNSQHPKMMNAEQFARFHVQYVKDANRVMPKVESDYTPQTVDPYWQNPERYAGKSTDWFGALTRTAPIRRIQVSAMGGNSKIKSYLSGSFLRQKGVYKGSYFNQVTFRANVTAQATDKLKVGVRVSPSFDTGTNWTAGSGRSGGYFNVTGVWMMANPAVPVRQSDGSFTPFVSGPNMLGVPNPVQGMEEITKDQRHTQILSSFFATYDILKDLTLHSSFNARWRHKNYFRFHPSTVGKAFGSKPPLTPRGRIQLIDKLNWANQNRLTYKHTINGNHKIKFMADFSVQHNTMRGARFNGRKYPGDLVKTLNAAGKITGGRTRLRTWALVSYLGRLNYSYKNKYLLEATIRRDGSSKFGPNDRWGTFPSISAGWVITNEPWMKDASPVLSNLKIRAEYGITGTQQIGDYAYAAKVSTSNYILNNSLASGKIIGSMGNQALSWEQNKQLDIGLNAGFVDNRLQLTFDFYRSTTESLLLNIELPSSSGFTSSLQNIGRVRNHGMEIGLKSVNIATSNFNWNTHLTFSLSRNKVQELGPTGKPIISNLGFGGAYGESKTAIGKPVAMFYGFKWLGLFQNWDETLNEDGKPWYSDAVPGALKIADINGDGTITEEDDFTIIGSPYPDFTYGITNDFSYKGLNLHVVMTGSYGAKRYKTSFGAIHNTDRVFNVAADQINRWRSMDDKGDNYWPTTVGAQNRTFLREMGQWSILNASYLWVKNISLSYSLPKSLTSSFSRGLKVYTSIKNAAVISSYPGNPASYRYRGGGPLKKGVDWGNYPTPRIISFGVKLDL